MMKVIMEEEDWIELVKPFYNGCKFRITIKNGECYIGVGCYPYTIGFTSKGRYVLQLLGIDGNTISDGDYDKLYNINVSPKLKLNFLKMEQCSECGGLR